MLTHARAAVAPRRAPPSLPLQPPEPRAVLLEALGEIEDEEHILVLGRDGPELMCALLRAGAPQVTHLRSHERLEAGIASLVIVPHVPSVDWLEAALPPIRRTLLANGRLAVCVDDTVARLHDAELIVGLKDATADVSRPTRLRARCGDAFMQWSGDDATALGYRAMGGIGCSR
jgi:Dihydrodipicolinate synthetase family